MAASILPAWAAPTDLLRPTMTAKSAGELVEAVQDGGRRRDKDRFEKTQPDDDSDGWPEEGDPNYEERMGEIRKSVEALKKMKKDPPGARDGGETDYAELIRKKYGDKAAEKFVQLSSDARVREILARYILPQDALPAGKRLMKSETFEALIALTPPISPEEKHIVIKVIGLLKIAHDLKVELRGGVNPFRIVRDGSRRAAGEEDKRTLEAI